MKQFLTFAIAILSVNTILATNYYLSSDGNDTNEGTSQTTPWKTINKLNETTLLPGDYVYFRAGDVFRGKITLNQGGNTSSYITLTSYGTGEKPIISGAESVTSWNLNGDYYQASFTRPVTSFFVDNQEMILARYPNDHQYLTLDSGQKNYLKDASITSLPSTYFDNAKICIHTAQWCWEKTQISSVASDQINFNTNVQLVALNQYGYFVYGNLAHLDVVNEWQYDSTTQLMSYKSSVDPNTLNCEASVYTNGIEIGSTASYISISQIDFEKQTNAGIAILSENNTHIITDNCIFKGQYNYGISDKGSYNEMSNNYLEGVEGIGIYCWGKGGNATIHHNTLKNIGQYRNYGDGSQINMTAIKCAFVNNCYIHHNSVDGAGYCGISADGGYHLVEKNIVTNAMQLNNDGGALHCFGSGTHHTIFQNNFVTASDGNTEGTFKPSFVTPAMYFDNDVNNCTMQNNTVYNRTQKGIYLNAGSNNNTIKGNTIYGCNYGIDYNGSILFPTQMTGMNVTENIFFAKLPTAYMVRMVDNTGGYKQGTIDYNYYFNPYNTANCVYIPTSSSTSSTYSLSNWQSTSALDMHSKESFVNWSASTSYETLFTNPTDDIVTVSLGTSKYLDLDNNEICASITLQPYTSKILINSNTSCPILSVDSNTFQEGILVYPNPFENEFFVRLNSNTNFEIYNQMGQVVAKGKMHQGLNTIDVSALASSMYFFKTDIAEFKTEKIIKK